MGEKVQVEVAGMRSVADGLDVLANKITGILNTVSAAADAADGCWGHDEYGDKFADGKSGYIDRSGNLKVTLASKSTLLQNYSTGLTDAAKKFEQTDDGNAQGFKA
ncbi:hypothetical protein JMUB6875_34310 [Nocardia sp. JMUB6875]